MHLPEAFHVIIEGTIVLDLHHKQPAQVLKLLVQDIADDRVEGQRQNSNDGIHKQNENHKPLERKEQIVLPT